MAPHLSVTLLGDTLGQRHKHLNSLVRAARESGTTVQDVETVPERSPADRLFKIDLAVSLRDADYILRNLKHDDMLFVSRALKARWLLDRHDIINPKYLADTLFPEMISPAVTKMKHWLYINLREPAKCQEFYEYYKQNSFEFAIKFLSHCSNHFILEEVPKILTKLSPHYLKVLCEKCPTVAKIYFDSLATQDDVKNRYLKQEQSYYNSIKCVLKSDADVFLDITEKYFSLRKFKRFSPLATDYIVQYHRSRVTNKLELYVAHILHIPTLAARLGIDECQEVVLHLARASYLKHWFQYKAVEPLIKRLHPQKRAAFKKRIFVDKDVGELVDKWPYETPSSPPAELDSDSHIFDDAELECVSVLECDTRCGFSGGRSLIRSKRNVAYAECLMRCDAEYDDDCMVVKLKTDLDRLFDEFRFIGFDHALQDLSHRVGTTGSTDRRRDIFLVLVSKTGGRTEAVTALLQLAVRHSNEPAHTRASVIRSLVKRAAVWRLPADVWQLLLDFSHGLGLDGSTPEAPCREGLHAVVIRQLLTGQCEPAIRDAFLKDFSTLAEYSLKPDERKCVADNLQNMLASAAVDVEPKVAADRLDKLLDVLKVFRIRVEASSLAVKTVTALTLQDKDVARPLLERLYNAKIARRELLRHNMMFRRDEEALLNALRHDPLALEVTQVVHILTNRKRDFDIFTAKLVVYFDQKQDFTTQLRNALKEQISKPLDIKNTHVKLARPLASILCREFVTELNKLDQTGTENVKLKAQLRACAHRARPIVNLAEWGWSRAGVKAVATHVMRCRETERAEFIRTLAAERRTVRVALALSLRSERGPVLDTFISLAKLRPATALRAALQYFRRRGVSAELGVWDIIKPLLLTVDLNRRKHLRRLLANTDWIPNPIKPAYITELYSAVHKISRSRADSLLQVLCKILPECDESIEKVLLQMFDNTDQKQNQKQKDSTSDSASDLDSDYTDIGNPAVLYPAIYIRYLMLSKSNEDLEKRFLKIGIRFIKQLEILRSKKDKKFKSSLDQVLESLRYNAAFFDMKNSSCLLVIQKILDWLQKFLPKEKYFQNYVHIHLTMLYFKAVRQSMKQMPEMFADPKRKRSEGVEAVGFVFGRYIAKEVAELVTTYFDSIIELYTKALVGYLENLRYGASREKFIGHVLKGFLADGVGNQRRLAVYTYSRFRYDVPKDMVNEIEEQLCKDKVIEMFAHAEIYG